MTRSLPIAAFFLAAACATAADVSVFQFGEEIAALAPANGRLHRVEIPGGAVKATTAQGAMARVDVESGVALVASVPMGVAGRLVHVDMGPVQQIELGARLAVVTAERGTAIYFPGRNVLRGVRISEGFPRAVMMHRDIAAVHWDNSVALYGFRNGRLIQYVFSGEGMRAIHVGQDTVITLWGPEEGTWMHVLSDQGFHSLRLSYLAPGDLSARYGKEQWSPIHAEEGASFGSPFQKMQPVELRGMADSDAAFSDVSEPGGVE